MNWFGIDWLYFLLKKNRAIDFDYFLIIFLGEW